MKKIIILLVLLSTLFIAAEQKEKSVLLLEDIHQEKSFQFVSVGSFDEVAIGLEDGIVYLYDKDGVFLNGYDFQLKSGSMYALFLNEDLTMDCYKSRSKKLCKYNREGDFIEEILVTNEEPIDMIKKMRSYDSRGVRYEVKKGNLLKIYPNGKEEIFYRIYYSSRDRAVVRIIFICATVVLFYFLWKVFIPKSDLKQEVNKTS